MGKSNQKIGKTLNYPSVQKSYWTSCKDIGGHKKREQSSKNKTTTLMDFDNLKKKQQDQGGKSWCYTENLMSVTISNLRTTALYFENKLLKQFAKFWIMCLFWWQKKHQFLNENWVLKNLKWLGGCKVDSAFHPS